MTQIKFGTGRGHKYHMIDPITLDNEVRFSVCGRRIDRVVHDRFVNSHDFCGNCERTAAYKNISTVNSVH